MCLLYTHHRYTKYIQNGVREQGSRCKRGLSGSRLPPEDKSAPREFGSRIQHPSMQHPLPLRFSPLCYTISIVYTIPAPKLLFSSLVASRYLSCVYGVRQKEGLTRIDLHRPTDTNKSHTIHDQLNEHCCVILAVSLCTL